ncbi:MAG: GMC family oxidoreductase [Deltaproteobacteria bacterium]|nr:GMC family oxidoreductase [Deltaproteobacteria bacterium]
MSKELSYTADVIVVGSGPGGATVARELTKGGKKVLILERGDDYRDKFYYGTYLGAIIYSEKRSLLFTKEGLNIIAPIMVGGATSMYTGCAAPPPKWLTDKYGVNIDTEVNQTIDELGIKPLPEELRGEASTRIAQAAKGLGYDWYPQPKFMNPERSVELGKKFKCHATTMLGCRCGAKWSAGEWVDDAVLNGTELKTKARVSKVIIENGRAVGVEGKIKGKKFSAFADTVVLSAGGIGSPRIMQASGFSQAGVGMTMDTTVMVYGFTKQKGTGKETPMTWSWENDEEGYMLSTLTDPWLLYPMIAIRKGLGPALRWYQWNKMLGIMIKLKDDTSGGVYPDGKISKPLTSGDEKSLNSANNICKKILIEAGADKSSIFMTPLRGTHPSGTVRIGEILDNNLQSEAKGLYVCDASVFPESLDRPTVLTIIGLGKRLAKHLLA